MSVFNTILSAIPYYRQLRVNGLLSDFLRYSASCDTLEDSYLALDKVLSRLLNYDRIAVRFADAEAGTISDAFISGHRVFARDEDQQRPLQGTATDAALKSGRSIIVSDIEDPEQIKRYPFLMLRKPSEQLPSMLITPVFRQDAPVGSIMLRSHRRGAYSARDADLLQQAADYITPTLMQTVQLQQLEREIRERNELSELGWAVSSTIDFDDVWDMFVSKTRSLISCDRLVVALVDDDGTTITDRFLYGEPVPGWDESRTRKLSDVPAEGILISNEARIIGMEENDDAHRELLGYNISERTGLKSAMYAPLIAGDRAIGTLSVRSKQLNAFSPQDLALFKRIAVQIGGPVAVAQMHTRLLRLAEEESARNELELRNRQLVEMSITKSRFISTISHELRTPLTSILAFSDLIKRSSESQISERDRKHLEVITRSGERLKVLINDLLDISYIEAEVMRVNGSVFSLPDVIDGIAESVGPMLEVKSQSLAIDMPADPVQLTTDRERLEQILTNLISNASKYSDQGSEITLQAMFESGRISISVIDQGPGIEDSDYQAVFEAFNRLDNEVTRSNEGTGLGLAISRKLATALGGNVDVVSGPGGGAIFTVSLPATLPEAA